MGNILIHLVDLPSSIKGVTAINSDGDYIIFINSNLCEEQVEITRRHELEHLSHNHFQSDDDIGNLELEASL